MTPDQLHHKASVVKPPFYIRTAAAEDVPLIRRLAHATWPTAYRGIISPAQIAFMLGRMYAEAELKRQLAEHVRFMLLFRENQPIGFAGCGPAGLQRYKLHKLYVLPHGQGSGAGKRLLQAVCQYSRAEGAGQLVLNVNRQNPAVGFYRKMGFSVLCEVELYIGSGFYMSDYLMAKPLPGTEPG